MAPIITLLTDFGPDSSYVGIMKGVIYRQYREALIVDLTHNLERQNVLEAAFLTYTSYAPFPPGTIHVAVVDPKSSEYRRAICLQVPEVGYFVGPDNGLLSYILDQHPNTQAREITNLDFMHYPVNNTFHGRDIFAPTTAHLASGARFEEVGPMLDKSTLVWLANIWPEVIKESIIVNTEAATLSNVPPNSPQYVVWNRLHSRKIGPMLLIGQVVHIDHFGNLITNISRQMFDETGFSVETAQIIVEQGYEIKGIQQTYEHQGLGKIIALFGSRGFLEIARVNGRADVSQGQKITTGQTVDLMGVTSNAARAEVGDQNR